MAHAARTPDPVTYRSRRVWRRVPGFLLPLLALLLVGLLVVLSRDRVRDRYLARQNIRDLTRLQAEIIARELETVTATLLHFADQKVLREFLADRSTRREIEREYNRFSLMSGDFDQLRLIDEKGREMLRVNYNGGDPAALPVAQLQSKSERYYFRLAIALQRNQVYLSPFDLNQEHGEIEVPWKPVQRLATPVFDDEGNKRGILVFNYLGERLLERLNEIAAQAPGWTGVVNKDGYYLEGPDADRSWGFMFGHEPSFATDHPEAWKAIRDRQEGSFTTNEGIFDFRTVMPAGRLRTAADEFPIGMKIVSFVPTASVYEASAHTFGRMAIGALVVALILFVIAVRLAFVGALREEHELEIAASERRLRVLSSRLLDSQEHERKHLARDLHDELGQLATAITIDLKRARKAADSPAKDELIERSIEGTAGILEAMHRISSRIRSSILDDIGLGAALRACGEEHERSSGTAVKVELDFDEERLPERVAENAYRIVQEALTNVMRHAQAKEVSVRVSEKNGELEVRVRDRGVGFDPESMAPDRLGLLGMRERAELLGGSFEVHSSPEQGTVVEALIPLAPPELD